MIDGYGGETTKNRANLRQGFGVDIDFGMPSNELVNPSCEGIELRQVIRTAAMQVESDPSNALLVEAHECFVGYRMWKLRHADEARTEPSEGVHQIALIVMLERSRNDRAAEHFEMRRFSSVILAGEGLWQEPLVFHKRKTWVDDVQMGIEKGSHRGRIVRSDRRFNRSYTDTIGVLRNALSAHAALADLPFLASTKSSSIATVRIPNRPRRFRRERSI